MSKNVLISSNKLHDPRTILNSFASVKRFKICLVIGMSGSSILPTSGIVIFWGQRGTGKTTFLKSHPHIDFDHDILKSRDRTIDFLGKMDYSKIPLVLDDYETVENCIGIKELRALKRTAFFIVTTTPIQFPSSIRVDAKDFGCTYDFTSTYDGDIFESPKTYVENILTNPLYSLTNSIDRYMTEHGHTFGYVQENYVNYTDDIEILARVADSFSWASVIDTTIYKDTNWNLLNYFNVSACLIPASLLKMKYKKSEEPIRVGSMWTKFSNSCMKANRLKRIRIHLDAIFLVTLYLNQGIIPDAHLDSYDIDTVKQLSLLTKVNPKMQAKLKKSLRSQK